MSRTDSSPAGDTRGRARPTSPWERTSQARTTGERWAATATIGLNQRPSFFQHQNLPFRTAAAATVGLNQQPSAAQRQDPPFRTAAAASVGLNQLPLFAQRQDPLFRTAAAATVGLNQQPSFAQPSLAQRSVMQHRDFTSRTTTAATAGLSQRPSSAQRQDSPFLATIAATGGLSQPTSAQRIGLNLLDRRATAPIVGEPSYENGTPHASPAIRTPVLGTPWASVLETRPTPARTRNPMGIPTPTATATPVTVNGIDGGVPILGSPTQIDQSDSRQKAATSLLTLIPVSAASLILGYGTQDTSIPKEWEVDLASFIASWSDSSISQCSLALRELNHFLNKSAGTPCDVPPVQLRAFLVEAALRGTSVPRSRLDGLCFAVNHLRITGIPVKAEIVTIYVSSKQRAAPEPMRDPRGRPFRWSSGHLERISASEHLFPVVRYYAATFSLCCFRSLRPGTAKKPSSRAPKPFTWSASTQGLLGTVWALPIEEAWGTQSPSDLRSIRVDFLFPALDSYSMLEEPRLACPIKKAEHQEIEHAMRALLAFNPLRMPRS
ncbi:hypothetical protein T492DRAFT_1079194, partial [Pavlovales sp. CCMP2436]